MTSATTAQGYADSGKPVKTVGEPVFYEPLAAAFDRDSELDATSLVEAVDSIVGEMHEDGSLSEMSKEWYNGLDLTVQQ
jgi:polar amino acid transport system substrate-binding protein